MQTIKNTPARHSRPETESKRQIRWRWLSPQSAGVAARAGAARTAPDRTRQRAERDMHDRDSTGRVGRETISELELIL